tara:strand:+ start:84793 stop:84960 length:168 start_codon:yes stop_codon:yes gene_type:complete
MKIVLNKQTKNKMHKNHSNLLKLNPEYRKASESPFMSLIVSIALGGLFLLALVAL